MELAETIDSINSYLTNQFGIDTVSGLPIWRVVFSEDQFEKRLGTYEDSTPGGIYLRTVTEVREVPKYRQWIVKKYVLERMVVVPDVDKDSLPTSKVSYEPIWVFEDKHGNYLPPRHDAAKFIVDTIYASQYGPKTHGLHKYVDEESSQEAALDYKERRIDKIQEELFGDQSSFAGTTKTGETIIVPQSYEKKVH